MDRDDQPLDDSPPPVDGVADTVAAWPHRPKKPKLRHQGHGNLTVEGVTGTVYRFIGHGAVQRVNPEDAAALLEMATENKGCCGNSQVYREQLLVEVRE